MIADKFLWYRIVIMKKSIKVLVLLFVGFLSIQAVFAHPITEKVEIQIVSTSDVHGKLLPYDYMLDTPDYSGSLSQISTAFKSINNENTIFIDVGDLIQGNMADLFLNDPIHPMVHAQNLMNYDIWVPGNHEFNYGMDVVRNVIDQHEATVLCGNVYYADGSSIADKYVILERSGVKIGIIGMVTPNITKWDKQHLEEAGVTVTDPVEEIREITNLIRDKVDILIAACHMDCENEYELEDSGVFDLADKVPELDLILAAHGHKRIKGIYRNDVLITENNDLGKTMSLVTFTIEKDMDGNCRIIGRDPEIFDIKNYREDFLFKINRLIREADKRAKAESATVISYLTNEALSPADEIPGIAQAKIQDTALIRLINDVQMYYSGAQISCAALFLDNNNLYQGDICKSDVARIFKNTNSLAKVRMTGRQLKIFMEWSYNYINTFHEGDLTISFNPEIRGYNYLMFRGVKYLADISKPAGERIINLTLPDGTPIDPDEKYTVAVNSHTLTTCLSTYDVVFNEEQGLPEVVDISIRGDIGGIRELIVDYIANVASVKDENGKATLTLEDVTEENADWRLVGYSWDEEKHAEVARLVKEGIMSTTSTQDGRYTNIRTITEKDLLSLI